MLIDNIWVINMDKSIDRLTSIQKNFELLNIKFKKYSAINGSNLSDEQILNESTFLCRNLLCNKGMIGCALSHKNLWKQLLNDENTNAYVIMEDDAQFDINFVKSILKIDSYLDKYSIDLINLYCVNIGCGINKIEFEIDEYKFGKSLFPLTLTGYIITKVGAKKLLDIINKINYHIDFQIANENLTKNLNYYVCFPPLVLSDHDNSTINNKSHSVVLSLLNTIGFKYITWLLNVPIFNIKMIFVINIWLIILLLSLLINNKTINNSIINLIIIIEIILYI